jgi:antirestriction protein ArdC
MTWNQLKQRGGSVKKGEHGSLVVKYGKFKKKIEDEEGAEKKKSSAYIKGYKVFNALQIHGIEFPAVASVSQSGEMEKLVDAGEIVRSMPSPPEIREGRHEKACYRRATDTVDMPARASFEKRENFYLTLFHELVHATGHQSRLNRKSLIESDGFGGEIYSQEELVAEMGAAFLGAEADIVRDEHEQSAAYLKGWLDVLRDKDHKRWIVQGANQAGKAADFILNRSVPAEPVAETAVA